MEFSKQEYWNEWPFLYPGIEPRSPALQADSLPAEPLGKPNYLREILIMKYRLPW